MGKKDFRDWETRVFDSFEIYPHRHGIDLDVGFDDSYYGPDCVSLDAIELYQILKGYFEETEYE